MAGCALRLRHNSCVLRGKGGWERVVGRVAGGVRGGARGLGRAAGLGAEAGSGQQERRHRRPRLRRRLRDLLRPVSTRPGAGSSVLSSRSSGDCCCCSSTGALGASDRAARHCTTVKPRGASAHRSSAWLSSSMIIKRASPPRNGLLFRRWEALSPDPRPIGFRKVGSRHWLVHNRSVSHHTLRSLPNPPRPVSIRRVGLSP